MLRAEPANFLTLEAPLQGEGGWAGEGSAGGAAAVTEVSPTSRSQEGAALSRGHSSLSGSSDDGAASPSCSHFPSFSSGVTPPGRETGHQGFFVCGEER